MTCGCVSFSAMLRAARRSCTGRRGVGPLRSWAEGRPGGRLQDHKILAIDAVGEGGETGAKRRGPAMTVHSNEEQSGTSSRTIGSSSNATRHGPGEWPAQTRVLGLSERQVRRCVRERGGFMAQVAGLWARLAPRCKRASDCAGAVLLVIATLVSCTARLPVPAPAATDDIVPTTDATVLLPDATTGDTSCDAADLPTSLTSSDLLSVLAERPCRSTACCPNANLPSSFLDTYCVFNGLMYDLGNVRARLNLYAAGRLSYDPVAAARCVGALGCVSAFDANRLLGSHSTRDDGAASPSVCGQVFRGNLAAGKPCEDDAECATGRCWGCPGVCTAAAAAKGDSCDAVLPCADGLYCVNQHCVPFRPRHAGESCSTLRGDLALDALECDAGLYCALDQRGQTGQCVALKAPGTACTWADQCSEWRCVAGKCADKLLADTLGKPCTNLASGPGMDCRFGEVCVTYPWTSTGICAPNTGPWPCGAALCPAGTLCASATPPTCLVPGQPGESCAVNPLCTHGCGADKKCAAWKPCKTPNHVGWCEADYATYALPGDACKTKNDCWWQVNIAMECTDGVCARVNPACAYPNQSP